MSRAVWYRSVACLLGVFGLLSADPGQAQTAKAPSAAREQKAASPKSSRPAVAAPQAAPAAVATMQLKSEPSQTEWTKLCGKDPTVGAEVCTTTRDFVSDQGRPLLGMAVYDVKARQPRKMVRFRMPHGLLLPPGIRLAVDRGKAIPGHFATCVQTGCYAEAELKDDFLSTLKKGSQINVSVRSPAGQEVTFAIPAEGFGKAYDGAPIDPQVLAERQRKQQDELERKSDELRRRLVEQSRGSPTTEASAAPRR